MEIESILGDAAAELRVGEMLRTDDFDLFQVMSAVEIGDSRLDAGDSLEPFNRALNFASQLQDTYQDNTFRRIDAYWSFQELNGVF